MVIRCNALNCRERPEKVTRAFNKLKKKKKVNSESSANEVMNHFILGSDMVKSVLRKMKTLYTRQQKRHRSIEQSFGLCGRRWGWDDLRDKEIWPQGYYLRVLWLASDHGSPRLSELRAFLRERVCSWYHSLCLSTWTFIENARQRRLALWWVFGLWPLWTA